MRSTAPTPMKTLRANRFLRLADGVLRGALPGQNSETVASEEASRDTSLRAWLVAATTTIVFLGAFYGAAMGAYGLSSGAVAGRALWPIGFGALKVPLLLLMTGALSLPPFFVLYTLSGLRDDFSLVLRALLATQIGLSAILASLAPFTLLCYFSLPASSANYAFAVLWNFAIFALASTLSQTILRFHLRPLWRRDARHLKLLRAWMVIYSFIGVQLAWVLRPFVGDPSGALSFLRADAFSNAYLAIWGLLLRAIGV